MSSKSTPPPATPNLASFQPGSGPVATPVTITGTNLMGATAVSFNGKAATFTVTSATQIAATVPSSATTGKISVTTPNGNASSAANFTVTVPAPAITSFSPSSGLVGAGVTITGTNLTGATAVAFNGHAASFTANSATQISTTVPSGATTGKISVTTPGGSASSANNFTVTVPVPAPTITSFAPTSGQVGTGVTITGTNLTGATAVAFSGHAASFTVNSATQISTTVPSGATTGKIAVTTPGGSASSAANFTVTTSSSLDLTIDGLYVTQATQDYPNPIVPLVKDRSAWVRVFVRASTANTVAPQVRVQFINGSTTNTLNISAPSASVPTTIDANTNTSWDAAVSAAWIQPGVQVVATVDPANAIPESNDNNNQFSANLDVRTLSPWKVTLIPVHTGDGRTGVVTSASRTANDWVDFAKRLHPVPDAVNVVVGASMNSTVTSLTANGTTEWSKVLSEVAAKRSADGVTDRYYYGVVKVGYTSGIAGIGYIGFPAAIGWDYSSGPNVLAHEEGHNFGRPHSPCGGAGNPDPNYPYPGGIIGVPGWDAFASSSNLKMEAGYTDVMGYCSTQWISDYVYISELNFRASNGFDIAPDVVGANGAQEGLLVWGRIENDQMILEPAFRVPVKGAAPEAGPYTWEARDSLGKVLASIPFDAPEVADLPNTSVRIFSFVVPMTPENLSAVHSLHLSKGGRELVGAMGTGSESQMSDAQTQVRMQPLPDRRLQLSWDAARYPVLMLRDARTGEVRGFARGGSALLEDAPEDLEVNVSDGIRGRVLRYRQPER